MLLKTYITTFHIIIVGSPFESPTQLVALKLQVIKIKVGTKYRNACTCISSQNLVRI